MPFCQLYYHLIWATDHREPWIDARIEPMVYSAILGKARELGMQVHAIGGTEDHIHFVVSIPPRLSVSDCLRQLKGASAYYANHQAGIEMPRRWQEGYGALTFGPRSRETVVAYVQNQKQHHASETLIAVYERYTEEA